MNPLITPERKGNGMKVKVLSTFQLEQNAREARVWEGKQMPAEPARIQKCGLVEILDESGVRVRVEFPATYTREIKSGDILTVESGLARILDRPARLYNISSYQAASSK